MRRAEFSQVLNDAEHFYILFSEQDTARRAQIVMDRHPFQGISLALFLHEVPVALASPAEKLRQLESTKSSAQQTREDIILEARDIIMHDIAEAFLKDLKNRLIIPQIRRGLDKEVKSRRSTQNLRQDSVAASDIVVKTEVEQPVASTSSLPPEDATKSPVVASGSASPVVSHDVPTLGSPAQKKSAGGLMNLPKFARRKPRFEDQGYDRDRSESTRPPSRGRSERTPSQRGESVVSDVIMDGYGSDGSSVISRSTRPSPGKSSRRRDSMDVDSVASFEVSIKAEPIEERSDLVSIKSRGKIRTIASSGSEQEPEIEQSPRRKTKTKPKSPKKAKKPLRDITFTSSEDEAPVSPEKEIEIAAEEPVVEIVPVSPLVEKAQPEQRTSRRPPAKETRAPVQFIGDQDENVNPFSSGLAEDEEDLYYLRLAIERLRMGQSLHPPAVEPEAEEAHQTGSARTEGYYKIAPAQKSAYLPQRNRAMVDVSNAASSISVSRNARASTRALVHGIEQQRKSAATDTDVLKFNQLRTRKKQLKFARSPIRKSRS